MKKIDINTYKRKELLLFNKNMTNTFYGFTINVDVTNIYNFAKKNKISFYLAYVWVWTKAINSIDEFHYEMINNDLYYIDERYASFTDTASDDGKYKVVNYKVNEDIINYCINAKEKSNKQNFFINLKEEENDLIYFTCEPWFDFTSAKSSGLDNKMDSIPRIGWAKLIKNDDKITVNTSIEVNHCYIDGYHIGQVIDCVNKIIKDL